MSRFVDIVAKVLHVTRSVQCAGRVVEACNCVKVCPVTALMHRCPRVRTWCVPPASSAPCSLALSLLVQHQHPTAGGRSAFSIGGTQRVETRVSVKFCPVTASTARCACDYTVQSSPMTSVSWTTTSTKANKQNAHAFPNKQHNKERSVQLKQRSYIVAHS